MNTLYIIRHGQTEWNVEGRMQGHLDSALTPAGQEQSIASGRALRDLGGVDELIVSPSGRARETAFLLNSFLSAEISFEALLMERDCGHWSGLTLDEIKTQYPREWESRQQRPFEHCPPGGESTPDLIERIRPLLAQLVGRGAERIGLVTHGVTSRAILTELLGLQPAMAGRVRHPNEVFYRLEFTEQSVQPSHFVAGKGPVDGLLHGAVPVAAAPPNSE